MDNTETITIAIDNDNVVVVDTTDTEPSVIDNKTYDNDVCIDEQKETRSIESIIIDNSNSISAPNSSNNSYVISSSVSSGNKSNEDILSYINNTIYLWNKDIEPNTDSNEDSNIILPISSRLNIFDNKDIIPEIMPVIPEIMPDNPEIMPVIPEIIPTIKEIMPDIKEIIPTIKEIIPDIPEIMPVIPEIMPDIKEIIPTIKEIIPVIPEIIPDIKEIIPVKDNISNIVSFNSDNIKDIISYSNNNNNNNNNNINNIENIISNGRSIGRSIGNSNSIENSIENDSVFNSESEFSYTKNLSICNTPNILRSSKNTSIINIKKSKSKHKNKNSENELDDIDYLYNKLQDYIRYMDINRSNYILIIVKAIEIIDNHNNLFENNKKHTVTKAINRLLTIDLELSEFDKNLILLSLNNIIEIIINCSKTQDNTKADKAKHNIINYNNINNINIVNSGQIIHSLIDKITTIIIKKQYNVEKLFVNIATITNILIILVNKYSYINNIEKKYIIIQAFNKFVNERLEFIITISKDNKKKILMSLESVQITIDIIVGLQNGEYKINSSETTFENKKKSIFNCFKKQKDYDT